MTLNLPSPNSFGALGCELRLPVIRGSLVQLGIDIATPSLGNSLTSNQAPLVIRALFRPCRMSQQRLRNTLTEHSIEVPGETQTYNLVCESPHWASLPGL